jgi:Ca2+-binding EF-hand superfamily protein
VDQKQGNAKWWRVPSAKALFDRFDTNRDGLISRQEIYGAFEKIDVNRNKAIERSELAQATLKYFSKICNDKVFKSDRSGRKL